MHVCEFSRSWLLVTILAEVLIIAVVITVSLQWQGREHWDTDTTTRGGHSLNSALREGGCGGTHYVAGAVWKEKSFCQDFLVKTFHEEIPVCGGVETAERDQVKCYGSVYAKVATCMYENLSVRPRLARSIARSDTEWNHPEKTSISLIMQDTLATCASFSIEGLQARTNAGDFETKLTQYLLKSEKVPTSVCDVWMNKTTFLHISNAFHVYFRFLDLYNVHKAIIDYSGVGEDYQVVRIGNLMSDYLFPEFDKVLFPGALTLDDLQKNGTVCFRKVVLVPTSYQSLLFRCKMNRMLRSQCFECNGKGLTGSPFYSFRRRVLQACNITETDYCNRKHTHLTVVSRKPYKRWPNDDLKKFQRVLRNEDDMIAQIRETFPNATVRVVHLEDLDMCEQVKSAVEADVMMGVHGAGLVHFWWLREDATGLELEPSYESGNPSFRMLTTLVGRNYVSEMVGGVSSSVSVNIQQLVEKLKQIISYQ